MSGQDPDPGAEIRTPERQHGCPMAGDQIGVAEPVSSLSRYCFRGLLFAVVALVVRGWSGGAGEVVEAGDAAHRDRDAFALQAAVAEDLPGLHSCEGVLDAGSDLSVRGVELGFPGR